MTVFTKSFTKEKLLKKMQQGGGVSVFAPEPNQYRAPVPGIDPNIYRFSPTAAFDMSPLLEMQKQQQATEIQRQNAALAREKMMHQSMIQERKFAMDQEKELFNMFFSNNAKSGGQATDAQGNLMYSNNDPSTSARFAPMFKEYNDKKMQLFDEILHVKSLPYNTKNKANILARLYQQYSDLSKAVPTTAEMEADARIRNRAMELISKPQDNMRVNMPAFNEWVANSAAFYRNEPGSDKLYRLGEQPAGLFYDYKAGQTAFDDAMKRLNTPVEMGEGSTSISANNIITQDTQKLTLSTDMAAERLADLVLANPNLRAYIQDTYNMKLYAMSPDDPLAADDRQAIIEAIKPLISYDDDLQTFGLSTSSKFVGQASAKKDQQTTQEVKDESTSVLSTFSSNYYDSDTGQMRPGVPQSEIGRAASALTTSYANVYGDDAKSNELRTKLDRVSYEFIQAGGNFNDPDQLEILQGTYNAIIADPDYKFMGDDLATFKNNIRARQSEARSTGDPLMLGIKLVPPPASSAAPAGTSTSAADLAKMTQQ